MFSDYIMSISHTSTVYRIYIHIYKVILCLGTCIDGTIREMRMTGLVGHVYMPYAHFDAAMPNAENSQ